MPRPRQLAAVLRLGLVAWLAGACSVLEPVPPAAAPAPPSPLARAGGSWVQDLTFTGDAAGTLTQIVAGDPAERSACTGQRGHGSGAWVLTLYGEVGGQRLGLQATVDGYRGPGTYRAPQASAQVFKPDGSAGWRAAAGDAVVMTIDLGEESGTLEAHLTDLQSDQSRLTVRGRWNCQT